MMFVLRTFARWRIFGQKTYNKLLTGFSLVELMVTITLMAVVGVGIVSLMDYVNSTRVRVQKSVELIDNIDQSELYIRTKLKTADRIEINANGFSPNENEFSSECLLLLTRQITDRTGVNFKNNNGKVATDSYRGPGEGSSFTLGMWFKRDNESMDTFETMARWGRYTEGDNTSIAFIMESNGGVGVRIGARMMYVTNVDGLHDDRWHSLVASFDNVTSGGLVNDFSWTMYIDGYPRQVTFLDDDVNLQIDTGTSADYFEIGTAFDDDSDNMSDFDGLISDLQLYSTSSRADQASVIFTDGAMPSNMDLELHWNFKTYTEEVFPDVSGQDRPGNAADLSETRPTITTTDERYIGDVFAMIDMPNDGNDNYELKYRSRHNDCPQREEEASGFETISTDIFVRPEFSDFFTFANRDNASDEIDANDLIFNYGYRSGRGRASFSYEAAPKKLALNKKFFDADFCRADPNLVLNAPPGVSSCNIERGFAYIATDYDNQSDELFIPNARYWEDNQTYYDIPNAPSNVRAQWSSATGVMSYTLADNGSLPIEEWEATMRSLAYRPTAEDYAPTKDIVVSLGYLPMMVGSEYHFYDFVEIPVGDTINWLPAQTAANNAMFCGTAGYLATVTSGEENDFLIERFRKSTGSIPAGWIGGSDHANAGDWVWDENSPEGGSSFWHQTNMASGNASGRPMRQNGEAVPDGSYDLEDDVVFPETPLNSFTRRTTVSTDPSVILAYHNLASDEPNNHGGSSTNNREPYMQLVGSTLGNGYWNDLADNRECKDDEKYWPCGYYIEFGGRPGESLNSLVFERTVDVSAQREFCGQ